MKSYLKRLLLPAGRAPRRIRGGLLAGLRCEIDLGHHTQIWLGLQEREVAGWFRRLSRGISTAVDVGANEGFYTLYFLARTPAQKVLAFEPELENLPLIKRNVALNTADSEGRLKLVASFVGRGGADGFTSLDQFVDEIVPPCLIKVDIDGGEVDLLRGAERLLRSPGMRWIIEVHSAELERECLEILRQAGYRPRVVPNAWWRAFIPELRPIGHNRWLVATREER